jgi:Domain of unknown function (DUF2427).
VQGEEHSSGRALDRNLRIGEDRPLPDPFLFLPFFLDLSSITTMQSRLLPLAALALAGVAYAHGGHEAVPEGSTTSEEPIVRVLFCSVPDLGPVTLPTKDSTLWVHMILMGFSFGIIFPTGMVLGVCLVFFLLEMDGAGC